MLIFVHISLVIGNYYIQPFLNSIIFRWHSSVNSNHINNKWGYKWQHIFHLNTISLDLFKTWSSSERKVFIKKGLISKEELTKVENTEIEKLIAKQKAAGYHVITDGEYRRAYWHLDFFWGLNGIEQTELSHGYFSIMRKRQKAQSKLSAKFQEKTILCWAL